MAKNEIGALIHMLRTKYHVPQHLIERLRIEFTQEAVQNGRTMQYDRIMTGIGLAAARKFKFGAKRIFTLLTEFDKIAGDVNAEKYSWTDAMEELDNLTGIIVQSDPDRFVAEYRGRDWRRLKEIEEAENQANIKNEEEKENGKN